MQLKYDSEFCGSLPLHYINHIQQYGVLLVLEKNTLNIVQVSQNTAEHLGLDHTLLLKKSFKELISEQQASKIIHRCGGSNAGKIPFKLTLSVPAGEKDFLCLLHPREEYLIIEIETADSDIQSDAGFVSVYQELKFVMAALEQASSLQEVCTTAVSEMKKISGFDRVLAYQFDEYWNGLVIAEVVEENMEPYLGLRFPASDIPQQARALYLQNPYRLIPDRNYEPVKLHPVMNPLTQTFTDLSDCNLRSVATVHIEYLKNMKVMASMSIRILVDGKLWGLISCHHRSSMFLSYDICSVFELLSGIISSKIASLYRQESLKLKSELQTIQSQLVEQIYSHGIPEGLLKGKLSLLDLFRAEGAAVIYNNEMMLTGTTPDPAVIQELVIWLQSRNIDAIYSVNSLVETYDTHYKDSEIASGMIVLPVNFEKGEYIIVFRPEVIRKVNWGGNPDERIQFEEDRKVYHPRNSFGMWLQTVKNTSVSWRKEEIDIAGSLRNTLLEYAMKNPHA